MSVSGPCLPVPDRERLRASLLRGHREALAPLRAAALQHQTSVLRAHPDKEPVSAPAAAPIRLKRTLHSKVPEGKIVFGWQCGRLRAEPNPSFDTTLWLAPKLELDMLPKGTERCQFRRDDARDESVPERRPDMIVGREALW